MERRSDIMTDVQMSRNIKRVSRRAITSQVISSLDFLRPPREPSLANRRQSTPVPIQRKGFWPDLGRQRAKSFDDARGCSAIECAACLDASVAKRIASEDRIRRGKEMLARIVAMLTRVVDRFDANEYRISRASVCFMISRTPQTN
jgi:hypothetical protein